MNYSDFCKTYLKAQGVMILAPKPVISVVKEKREGEFTPIVNQYERGN
jgi:hypothetical protein